MQKEIIAIVGMAGSGKSVVSDFLVKKGYQFLRLGQITLDEVKKRGLQPEESIEREIREGFRQQHGMAAFAILNKQKIDELLEKGPVVLDGLYSWSELKYLKEKYGDKIKVLAVNSPPELRYVRLQSRADIDEQMRNRPITAEQAEKRDYAEIENIEKGGPIAMADITINNTGTKEDLYRKLDEIFGYKRPSWDEYFMKLASAVAERSTCLRHNIGSVIIKNRRILATGYNGAVRGGKDCLELGCKKDEMNIASGVGASEICRAVHSEQNAIIQAALHGISTEGATLYCTTIPCRMCAKEIVNAGIKKVITYSDYAGAFDSIEFLKEHGVEFQKVLRPKSTILFKD